jgi:hypothetical protein
MKRNTAELLSALAEKGVLLKQLRTLLQLEQSCLVSLDLEALEQNQQEILEAMERMATLCEKCKGMIGALGAEIGLTGSTTLSPVIARLPQAEQGALRDAQAAIMADSKALDGALKLNRGLLEDSLKVVDRSATFFNRLFNPGDTYGMAGSLVSRRGGSRFVCKEV